MTQRLPLSKMLPLLLCYAQDQAPVQGRTRLQKMLFMFEQVTRLSEYQYQAANFGPFSWRLSRALDSLVLNGLIKEGKKEFGDGAEKYEYSVTKEGATLVQGAIEAFPDYANYLQTMNTLKAEYNKMSLSRLLRFIYSLFPDYAVNSEYEFQY
jgi:uncharacterized protein